ncbi:hypothetical protein TNIN_20831, partial [Trichonephila inaurata madagascariensis]
RSSGKKGRKSGGRFRPDRPAPPTPSSEKTGKNSGKKHQKKDEKVRSGDEPTERRGRNPVVEEHGDSGKRRKEEKKSGGRLNVLIDPHTTCTALVKKRTSDGRKDLNEKIQKHHPKHSKRPQGRIRESAKREVDDTGKSKEVPQSVEKGKR